MQIMGHLDLCGPDMIEGWIFSPDLPEKKFDLEVFIDGELLADCSADRYRRDIRDAGCGDGFSAFRIRVPRGMSGDYASVRIRVEGTVLFLLPDQTTIIAERAAVVPIAVGAGASSPPLRSVALGSSRSRQRAF